MRSVLGMTITLALAAGPAMSAPSQVTIQTRPDQVGDRYAYTVERTNRPAGGAETHEFQGFKVEILEVRASGLRVAVTREAGPPTANPPDGVDPLWDQAWFGIRIDADTTDQGAPYQVNNTDEAEPIITAKIRKVLSMPDNAVFNSVAMRFEDRPEVIAVRWAMPDLGRIGVNQHRGVMPLKLAVEPRQKMGRSILLRSVEARDFDAARCEVTIIHTLDFEIDGRHQRVRTESRLSTRDGWTIAFVGVETSPDGAVKTTKIDRVGPRPGCG